MQLAGSPLTFIEHQMKPQRSDGTTMLGPKRDEERCRAVKSFPDSFWESEVLAV